MPENLWKLSVTYLFEDTDFPIGGLQPRFYNIHKANKKGRRCTHVTVCCFYWLLILKAGLLFIYLFIYLSIYKLFYLFICLFICLFSNLFLHWFLSRSRYLYVRVVLWAIAINLKIFLLHIYLLIDKIYL